MLSAELLVVVFHAILFQRQLYPRKSFSRAKKWGVPIMVCSIPEVQEYIKTVVASIRSEWFVAQDKLLKQVALTILDCRDVAIECWQFDFNKLQTINLTTSQKSREEEEQQRLRLQKLLREINCTLSFLPLLIGECQFAISVTDSVEQGVPKENIPEGWKVISAVQREVNTGIRGQFNTVDVDTHAVTPQVIYCRTPFS